MEDDSREFYLQTQLQALKLGNSLATTKCSEDGSKDVVVGTSTYYGRHMT